MLVLIMPMTYILIDGQSLAYGKRLGFPGWACGQAQEDQVWEIVGGGESPGQPPATVLDLKASFENQVPLTQRQKEGGLAQITCAWGF